MRTQKVLGMFCFLVATFIPWLAQAEVGVYIEPRHHDYYDTDDYYSPFTWGIGLSAAVPGNGFGGSYNAGFGADGNIGVHLNHGLSLLLAADSQIFQTPSSGIYTQEVNVMPSLKLDLSLSDIRPYVIVGAGINENFTYYPTYYGTAYTSNTNPVVSAGLGVAFNVAYRLDVYVQAKYEDVLQSGGNFSYVPIAVGVQFD